jgi:methionyl aminopeptidase
MTDTRPGPTRLETMLHNAAILVREGNTGKQVDEFVAGLIRLAKVKPAFLGYKPLNMGGGDGYPATICVSFNNEVIHGIPDDRKFQEGDVIKLDCGIEEDGQFDDGALTVIVGNGSATARRLVKATQEALEAGVAQAKAGNTTHDIGRAIEAVAKKYDVYVVESYGGHGIGEKLHMEPHVPNKVEGPEVKLESGMRIAIEPMFGSNHGRTYVGPDKWVIKLQNGGLAAHFEKTVTIK